MQCGAMLTEFGSPGYNGGFENDTVTAEEDGLSYIFWEWKDFWCGVRVRVCSS